MTIQTALAQGKELLEDAGIDVPRLTAEVLLCHAVGQERPWLVAHSKDELREVWWIHYGRYLHERMKGRPTQYITGRQEFYGREFRVTSDVLIPRPETEHVIEVALELLKVGPLPGVRGSTTPTSRSGLVGAELGPRILDVGTGSGGIAVTLSLETGADVVATDLSGAALDVARENGRYLLASVGWVLGDLANAFAPQSFDMVVSNPPYVARSDKPTLQREVRDFEPELALYGGDDGLEIYRRLIPEAWSVLRPGGWLVLEIGSGQGESVSALLRGAGNRWDDVAVRNDLAGLARVVTGRRR